MDDYNSIDEAVRDLIDRVGVYRHTNLIGNITASYDRISDLKSCIKVKHSWRKWLKELNCSLVTVRLIDLSAHINPIV